MGFDYYYGIAASVLNPPDAYIENEQLVDRIPGQAVMIEGKGKDRKTLGIRPLRVADQVMTRLTDKAIAWIDEHQSRNQKEQREQPFFLYFAPNAVHEPVTPAAPFTGSPFGKYGDFIQELDASVGRILATLDKQGLAKNTIVLFSSDNGGALNVNLKESITALEAGLAINGSLKGDKGSIWEGGFREPYLVRWPGHVPAGSVCDDIVSLSDTLATLAGILKAPLPAGAAEDSLDVSESWFGETSADGAAGEGGPKGQRSGKPPRESIVYQGFLSSGSSYAVRRGPWKFIERENPPPFPPRNKQMEQQLAGFRARGPKRDQLFNLAEDPAETKDVAVAHPEIVQELRKLLADARERGATRPAATLP